MLKVCDLLEQATKLERAGIMFIAALFAQLTELLRKNQRAWNAFCEIPAWVLTSLLRRCSVKPLMQVNHRLLAQTYRTGAGRAAIEIYNQNHYA